MITNVPIEKQVADDYLQYSMAVILGRAIPDFRDGLKPVARRILYGAKRLNLSPDSRYLKAARLCGEVMGLLHPHGSSYGAVVTMSQNWTSNAPLIDGHGNWGSPTDGAASERYTECKTTGYAWNTLLQECDTWETRPNYDESIEEPIYLNAKFPNVLTQITQGLAVGYATSTISHNLREIAEAAKLLKQNRLLDATTKLLPDCPTGCDIVKDDGLKQYLTEGYGAIRMRAKVEIIDHHDKHRKRNHTTKALVFTNLPINVNTEKVANEIKDGVESGKLTNIRDVIDGTDKTGIRISVIADHKANIPELLESIYRHTSLDTKYSAKLLVIHGNIPKVFAPVTLLQEWLKWRDERFLDFCLYNRQILLKKIHSVEGMIMAISILDDIISIIRKSESPSDARIKIAECGFSDQQAADILSLTLNKLTRLEENRLLKELDELNAECGKFGQLIGDYSYRTDEILRQISEIAKLYGSARRSQLISLEVQAPKEHKLSFIKIDKDKGKISHVKSSEEADFTVPFGCHLVFLLNDGKAYKVRSWHSGFLASKAQKILYWFVLKEEDLESRITLFSSTNRWNTISHGEMARSTSKGSLIMPDLERIDGYIEGAPQKGKGSRGNKF